MAPRRGGGSSSYGGGGGGSSGSDSRWLYKTSLYGSGWTSGYSIASVVFVGILALGLWAIAVWYLTIKKRAPGSRLISAWSSLKTALLVAVLVYTFEFIHAILSESQAVVAYVYFIIQAIIFAFDYLAQITLLTTLYTVFVYITRSYNLAQTSPSGAWKAIHIIHFSFCGLLGIIFLALLGYKISIVVAGGPDPYTYYYGYRHRPYYQLAAAYCILYMLASIEALAVSLFFFTKKSSLLVPRKILIVFPTVVAFPLMIRSIWEAAIIIRASLQHRQSRIGSYLAEAIFYCGCSLLAYGGIVLITHFVDKDFTSGGQASYVDQYANNGAAPPVVWPDNKLDGSTNGAMQQQGPPQYQRYVQPGTQQYPQQNGHAQGFPQTAPPPGQMFHPNSNQTSPVNGYGYPVPNGQQSPPPPPGGGGGGNIGQAATTGYPGMHQYGHQPQPQQLASQPVQPQMGELYGGQEVRRPGELPVVMDQGQGQGQGQYRA